MAHSDGLSARKRKFVAAMLTAPTVAAASTAAGISLRTGERYLRDPNVKRELSQALDEALTEAMRKIVGTMTGAVDTLETLHQDQATPPAVRVSAARALLSAGPSLRESTELAERVEELEDAAGMRKALYQKLGVPSE